MRKLTVMLLSCLMLVGQVWAQTRTITGTVKDEKGDAVTGASVTVKGTSTGTTSDESGNFSLSIPTNAKTLVISSINFASQEVSIGNRSNFTIGLKNINREDLEEVVVTGYSTRKKADFTGAASKVNAKQLEQVPMASFEQMLQGRAPGVYIASGSGQPGTTNTRVNIRGVGSISGGNDPLYVLDGVPIETSVFRSLNPNDFESIDILKDAAGAGLYGSRGANGVIVITSKKGVAGKTKFQYRGQMGYSDPPQQNNLRLMNTQERLRYEEQFLGPVGLGAGQPGWTLSPNNPSFATITPAQQAERLRLRDSIGGIDTNWPDILFRRGTFTQHEVNASGGSERVTFFTSLSTYKQEGVIHRSNLERYTFRGNLDFKGERATISIRSFAGFSELNNIESEAGVALANPIAAAYLDLPYRRHRNVNGDVIVGGANLANNAYDRLFTTTQTSSQFKGNLAIILQYKLFGGLSFKTTNGVDWRNTNSSRFIDPTSFAGSLVAQNGQGSYNEGNNENLQLISTTGLLFNRTFKDVHAINASLMYEGIRNKFRSFAATGFGINPKLPNTPAAITIGSPANNFIPLIGGSKTINGLSSAFATVDYTYNRKYTVSASIRRDAPSQVPANNRNNWFWTAGVNWNLMKENFMESQNFFQEFNVRASYGESANINGFNSDFGYIATYGNSSYAGVPAIIPTSPGNLDYKLESQVITNVGFDVSFWQRRARVTFDAYIKESQNLFVNQPLSRTTGFFSLPTNAGTLENRGIDASISVDVVSKKDLVVTVGVNGGFLRNRITNLGALQDIPQGTAILRVGLPIGSHFTVGFGGVDPQTGDPIYTDVNGNPTPLFSASNNRADFGTFLPSFTGGATFDVTYKGFFLTSLLSTAQGVKRFNNESFFYETTNSNLGFNKSVDLLNSWQRPGDITNFQRVGTPRLFSSKDVRDASFVRLRNFQVGYTFTNKNPKVFNSFRLWGQGQNLFTWTKWTGFDPEESNNIATYEFPNPRTFTIGLDINF